MRHRVETWYMQQQVPLQANIRAGLGSKHGTLTCDNSIRVSLGQVPHTLASI